MPLLRNGRAVGEDAWQVAGDDDALPPSGPVLVSFERWSRDRETLAGRNSPVGVRLKNSQRIDALAGDLDRLDLIALDFPKFNDGRAYSQARILRERLGYRGELRATGAVLFDQLLFMHRCGFDSFEIGRDDAVEAWEQALGQITRFYQPTADGRPALLFRLRAPRLLAEAAE
jgi:uncharacterized protein (DUF934 family)